MYSVWDRAFVVAVLVLMLGRVWSWGGPPNNDVSDINRNTAGGSGALQSNTTGANNTAFGAAALSRNTTGTNNTAFGAAALSRNTTGTNNTASGVNALSRNTDGSQNTASGVNALQSHTTGLNNTAIGQSAGTSLVSGDHNIYLDNIGVPTESATMRLGEDEFQTRTFIAGIAGTPLSGSPVVINATGQLGILASSARYKRDIQDLGARSREVLQLRPVTFRYTQDPQGAKLAKITFTPVRN